MKKPASTGAGSRQNPSSCRTFRYRLPKSSTPPESAAISVRLFAQIADSRLRRARPSGTTTGGLEWILSEASRHRWALSKRGDDWWAKITRLFMVAIFPRGSSGRKTGGNRT